jgi:predicted dehydrogenase
VLEAGKAVYCEAPLGRTVAEAEEMASAAGSLHTAIGLQGRLNPVVRRAAQLLSSGKIGRPLNARIVSTTVGFGSELPSSHDYFNKTSSGANLLTITAGHTLDVVEAVLGPILEVDARTEILWPTVKLTDTGAESLVQLPIRSPSWERRVLAPYSRPTFTVVWRRHMLASASRSVGQRDGSAWRAVIPTASKLGTSR